MNILVTGVSRGLGLKITELLLSQGHTVFGISRSKTVKIISLMEEYNNQLRWLQLDMSDSSCNFYQTVFRDFINNHTPIHGFLNNAATAYDDIITNANISKLQDMYMTNVISPIILTKYVIRNMLLHKTSGSIVHISSISAHTGYKGLSMYASTKGAIESFSKNTAREWGERGIRSNCIVAGFMETDMSKELSSDQKQRIYNRTSLKTPTSVESVAETTCFLLSDKAKSITGQNIFVDSGTI
jgi:3-oxoacyl-[acyl-carrier protein] reductase